MGPSGAQAPSESMENLPEMAIELKARLDALLTVINRNADGLLASDQPS